MRIGRGRLGDVGLDSGVASRTTRGVDSVGSGRFTGSVIRRGNGRPGDVGATIEAGSERPGDVGATIEAGSERPGDVGA